MILLAVTMIAFYATSFDAIAVVAASYSYKKLNNDEEAHVSVKMFWAVMLILLPIALVFSENSMTNLQSVSIIAAFPIGMVIPFDHSQLSERCRKLSERRKCIWNTKRKKEECQNRDKIKKR